jgi:hypothetical protein
VAEPGVGVDILNGTGEFLPYFYDPHFSAIWFSLVSAQ